MTDRERMFEHMRRSSATGILGTGTSIYGINVDTMNHEETRIALGWALTQFARLADPKHIGIQKETKQ